MLAELKKTAAFLLVLAVIFSFFAMPVSAEEGSCGANLKWTLTDGVLKISGSGDMTDFNEADFAPWYGQHSVIRRVEIENGVTSVGDLAFYGLENLVSVSFSKDIVKIGNYAFTQCKSLKAVSFPQPLKTIGESAFEECESLVSATLPQGLETLKTRAFYRCYSLSSVTFPKSLKKIGSSTFAYCSSLMLAKIETEITSLPDWTFYGCTLLSTVYLPQTVTEIEDNAFKGCKNLSAVYYPGDTSTGSKLTSEIKKDNPDFTDESLTYVAPPKNPTGYDSAEKDGKTETKKNEFTQSENADITSSEKNTSEVGSSDSKSETTISAVVKNDEGFSEVIDKIKDVDKKRPEDETTPIKADIVLTDTDTVNGDKLKDLAGKNVSLEITNKNGSVSGIDCSTLEKDKISGNVNLSYEVKENTAPTESEKKTIGDSESYKVSFNGDVGFKFSPKISLSENHAGKTATLYETNGKDLRRIQTVIVDKSGVATFFLASAKKGTDYTVAIDVAGEDKNAIIPDNMASEYGGNIKPYEQIEYEITGLNTFMGLSIGQFTWVVVGFLVLIVAVVGVIMFMFFKAKKKNAGFMKKKETGRKKANH